MVTKFKIITILILVLIVDLGNWFKREWKELMKPDYHFYNKDHWSGWG